MAVQHEVDVFSNRISIINPGAFANEFTPVDFANRDLHSYLRNEQIANVLYLCKDVESFGSGLKRIYSSCSETDVSVTYENTEKSKRTISRVTTSLQEKGLIKRVGSKKTGYWRVK